MSHNLYSSQERMALAGDLLTPSSLSLPPFCMDPSMMFHLPSEMYQFHRCQDLTLFSCVETPGLEHYYSSLYALPAQPSGQQYDNGDNYYGPSYVRKRNERERQRVKCVNEGYIKLRKHLPQEYSEKRLSKVQTLRAAIKYISHLQDVLCWESKEDSEEAIEQYETNQRYGQ